MNVPVWNRPKWWKWADSVFVPVPVGAILRSRFPPTTRERREKISAGAEEKECPPERATPLKRV